MTVAEMTCAACGTRIATELEVLQRVRRSGRAPGDETG